MHRREIPPRWRLPAAISCVILIWVAALWTVVEKARRFRMPLPILSAVFFGVQAATMTVLVVKVYLAARPQRPNR